MNELSLNSDEIMQCIDITPPLWFNSLDEKYKNS